LAKSATSGFGQRFGFTGDFADGVLVGVNGYGRVRWGWGKIYQYRKEDVELIYSATTHIQDEFPLTLKKAQRLPPVIPI